MSQADESPVVKVTYAVLLSAIKKRATEIWIRTGAIDFLIAGEVKQEMRPPGDLSAHIIRRVIVMAQLPVHALNEVASGEILLAISSDRQQRFAVAVRGHGDALEAKLQLR